MTHRPSLRPFIAGFFFGGANGFTWMIALGTPMVLLAERLGASTLEVGLASAFVFLLLPVQVFAAAALPRLGYKRQMMLGWGLRACFLAVPLALSHAAPEPPAPWMARLFVASIFGFCLFRAFGSAAHIPWFAAILPLEIRGRFFATDQSVTGTVGVGTLLLCAALFAALPPYDAFVRLYALALGGAVLAVLALSRLPSAPPPRPIPLRRLAALGARLCLQRGRFRTYLGLTLLSAVVSSSLAPFSAYYLKVQAGLPESRILLYTAASFVGGIAGALSIRSRIDRLEARRFFRLSLLLGAAVHLFWLALVSGGSFLEPFLALAYAGFGFSANVWMSAHLAYVPELTGEDERPLAVAVFTAVSGLFSGLAPVLWGLALRASGPEPGMQVGRFALFFVVAAALDGLLFALFGRIEETRPTLRTGGP